MLASKLRKVLSGYQDSVDYDLTEADGNNEYRVASHELINDRFQEPIVIEGLENKSNDNYAVIFNGEIISIDKVEEENWGLTLIESNGKRHSILIDRDALQEEIRNYFLTLPGDELIERIGSEKVSIWLANGNADARFEAFLDEVSEDTHGHLNGDGYSYYLQGLSLNLLMDYEDAFKDVLELYEPEETFFDEDGDEIEVWCVDNISSSVDIMVWN